MRNLTITAALLMGSSSLLAQTAQPTSVTPTGTMTPQASAAGTTSVLAGEAQTTTTTPTANAPTAVGTPAPDAAMTSETSVSTAAQAPSDTPAGSDAAMSTATNVPAGEPAGTAADAAAAASIGGGTAAPAATAMASADAPASDSDGDGALTPLEFAMHVDSANAALTAEAKRERFSRAAGNGAVKLLNATAADFAKADRNRDRKVDSTELAAWSGGASMTSGAGAMTPMPGAAAATADTPMPADTGATMTPSDASDVPEGQGGDDTMATDTPPNN